MLTEIETQIVALIATLPTSARLKIFEVIVAESLSHIKSGHAASMTYNILLTGVPTGQDPTKPALSWIATIKAIRNRFDLGLKDAKDIVDRTKSGQNTIIAKSISHADAIKAKALIEETGATVELLPT